MARKTDPRRSPTAAMRKKILVKTGGLCHVCGGQLDVNRWHADHVRPLAKGGHNKVDNYLPACPVCNGVRWNRRPQNIRTILRLGIIARTLVRSGCKLGRALLKSRTASKKLKAMRDDPDKKIRAAVRKVLSRTQSD